MQRGSSVDRMQRLSMNIFINNQVRAFAFWSRSPLYVHHSPRRPFSLFWVDQQKDLSLKPVMENQYQKCVIDKCGDYKYIVIELKNAKNDETFQLIRGSRTHEVHKDILAEFIENELIDEDDMMHVSCRGGGRISIDSDKDTIKIYGFSYAFGKADHLMAAEMLKKSLPELSKHEWIVEQELSY
eukprot:403362830